VLHAPKPAGKRRDRQPEPVASWVMVLAVGSCGAGQRWGGRAGGALPAGPASGHDGDHRPLDHRLMMGGQLFCYRLVQAWHSFP
jgi:hypothetical protein